MRELFVSREMNGRQREVGSITGDSEFSAEFRYSEDYLNAPDAMPISLSMPLRSEAYDTANTRNFFEGLLPEGFLRRTVAENNRTDAGDYLSLLEMLGSECLGAIQIKGPEYKRVEPCYRKLEPEMMFALAAEGATRSADLVVEAHLSLTGASGKVGAYKNTEGQWFLPVGSAPSTHILKQSHIRFDEIVLNEQLSMLTAAKLGIDTPKSSIVSTIGEGEKEEVLFATERYDRTMEGSPDLISGLECPLRLHQEDFGQALGIPAAQKYERPGDLHMKKMFDLLAMYSAAPIEDQMKLWDVIVFHYLIGNTDGHIKNFSLLYDRNLKSVRLAPAYDIISTVVYETHSHQMAFAIGGESDWHKLSRSDFEKATEEVRLNRKLFMKRFDDIEADFEDALSAASAELAASGYGAAKDLADAIRQRRQEKNN